MPTPSPRLIDHIHHNNMISEFLFDPNDINIDEIINYFEVLVKSEGFIFPRDTISTKDTQMFLNETLSMGSGLGVNEATMMVTQSIYYKWHELSGIALKNYMEKYEILKTRNFEHKFGKIQRTKPCEGFHAWHSDHTYATPYRQLVTLLYLNDDFEGGETEFLYQNVRIKPQAGKFVIFPPFWSHTHRGNPPIGGTKYIITSWADTFPHAGTTA
tara:strand:+ start:144 stop:785 length:642 start_codon:yes stop_codon:yes gene_type:complete